MNQAMRTAFLTYLSDGQDSDNKLLIYCRSLVKLRTLARDGPPGTTSSSNGTVVEQLMLMSSTTENVGHEDVVHET